jgi:cytochrome P450
LSLGLRKKDKDFNHKIKLYSAWGKEKIKELMEKNKKTNFEGKPSDIVAALYLERKQGKSDLFGEEDEIFNEFNSFLAAGTETASLYISMMIYLISLHP